MVNLANVLSPEREEATDEHDIDVVEFDQSEPRQFEDMTELFKQVVAVPILNTVFPLIEARAANELSEEDHARGKIILTMRDGDRN